MSREIGCIMSFPGSFCQVLFPVYVPFMVFGVSRFTISMGILLIVN